MEQPNYVLQFKEGTYVSKHESILKNIVTILLIAYALIYIFLYFHHKIREAILTSLKLQI